MGENTISMATRGRALGLWMRAGLWLAVVQFAALAHSLPAQDVPDTPTPHVDAQTDPHDDSHLQPRHLSTYFPSQPSIPPLWTIPVEGLGFAPPGALYLGGRNSLVSLDFLDENRLLFTFRVPALLRRKPGDDGDSEEREIRAVVLSLPSGAVEAEANWLLHDRARYLWMLRDGHFLLRDRNNLEQGDASLKLTPLLQFPGPLLSIALDPSQQFLVANSREAVKSGSPSGAASQPGPVAASSNIDTTDTSGANEPDLVLRILQRESGQVLLVTRLRDLLRLPINSEGYADSLHGNNVDWTVEMNFFTGGSRPLAKVKSACAPNLDFVSEHELLAMACADLGEDALVAMTTGGEKLWIDLVPDRQVWPVLTMAPNGQRVARESLYINHSITMFAPLGDEDIKGQWLQVLDSADGKVAFESPVSPVLDAGGNVAISPSGRRVALLNNGAIQIFELPQAPDVPAR